jgi:hypothetical protein
MNYTDPIRLYPDLYTGTDTVQLCTKLLVKLFSIVIFREQQLNDHRGLIFWNFSFVLFSTLLYLPPFRFHLPEDDVLNPGRLELAVRRSSHSARSHSLFILNDHPNLSGMLRCCINQCCGTRIRIQFFLSECESGSGYGSGSRKPNQYGSRRIRIRILVRLLGH